MKWRSIKAAEGRLPHPHTTVQEQPLPLQLPSQANLGAGLQRTATVPLPGGGQNQAVNAAAACGERRPIAPLAVPLSVAMTILQSCSYVELCLAVWSHLREPAGPLKLC